MVSRVDAEEPAELGSMLGALLEIVVEREAPILGRYDLAMWDYVILGRLRGTDGLSQTELSRRSGRDQTRLLSHLDRLDERGLIERDVDRVDRRRRSVRLSSEGRELLRSVHGEIADMEEALLGVLPRAARAELRDALGAVLRRARLQNSP